jgi:hypothetical protein
MDLINLIIRTIAFISSVWILLEFIITCKVDTLGAAGLLIAMTVATLVVFFLTQQNRLKKCASCDSTYLPPVIGAD